ncbi:unnamed protein product [Phyllotreta striolata]|uniref:WH2 domain-containing protein n=1 Tax=Phyllotreta striolata TaxID=444603 RepID=A0A9N9XLT7_PHYSR|nr:unnamed protein product [Phyllotreta striolata]
MPAGKESEGGGDGTVKRTTFRPPWVKEGPTPLPTPAQPWALKTTPRRDSNVSNSDASEKDNAYNPLAEVQLKPTKVNKKPEPEENGEGVRKNKILDGVKLRKIKKNEPKEIPENGAKESFFQKPALKPVPQREASPPKKDFKLKNLPTLQKASERVLKNPPRRQSNKCETSSDEEETDEDSDEVELDKEMPQKRNALVREASMRRLSQTNVPPPPPLMPGAPPPPPLMPGEPPKKSLTDKQKSRLNKLRARPKNRPDWNNLLQEIEAKRQLKHVVCNDRSNPILQETTSTADKHVIYKSEEANVHNELLKQIEKGIHLKKVKTNDRSKPVLDGLRKFRRQMTIEEQIQKSISMASMPPEEIQTDEIDEMDDIDKVRDDLQSTKQMLALELRNKEALERENKRLSSRIQNLEAELEKEKGRAKGDGKPGDATADEKVIKGLKSEAEEARRTSRELEKKYDKAAEELDSAKSKMDELKRQNQLLEKKLQEALMGKRPSISDRKHSQEEEDDPEEEEPEEESEGEDDETKKEKRLAKEVKQLKKKLQSLKTKEDNAKKERRALRDIIKKHQTEMKEEKKKYKQLKKEVDKMAALMKDTDEAEDDEEDDDSDKKNKKINEEDEDEEDEEEEDEEEDEDDDSEESEESEDSEQSQSEDEEADNERKKKNLTGRTKKHENRLNALKKGNFLLKTNAERLQDDLNKQKETTVMLQEDLDSVLSELG